MQRKNSWYDGAMGQCNLCGNDSALISREMKICLPCLRNHPADAREIALQAHRRSRGTFGLPEEPPRGPEGIPCRVCANECNIPDGGWGYCGLRKNEGGRSGGISSGRGKLAWYHDPLPTNCVADWVCPGGTGAGYPGCAYSPGPERGYRNLAVFFQACSFDCLYCQNWNFRKDVSLSPQITPDELVADLGARDSCICYFGGDPSPQLPFALQASRRALEKKKGEILRICWETNGSMHPDLLDSMVDLSLESGGCLKFDLKAWDRDLHIALTGVANQRTLENFSRVGRKIGLRPTPPLLIASTLLVPGYIDEEEVTPIAKFISSISPDIPYSLLAFYPQFCMPDLPVTSRALALRCLDAARSQGLKNCAWAISTC